MTLTSNSICVKSEAKEHFLKVNASQRVLLTKVCYCSAHIFYIYEGSVRMKMSY